MKCDVIYITVEPPFIRRIMFHDGNVEENGRKWDIRDMSDVNDFRNADSSKVNPDAERKMFCLNAIDVVVVRA